MLQPTDVQLGQQHSFAVCCYLQSARRQQISAGCRELVTPAYGLLARAMFQSIERLASTDSKHGDRLRLESYAYFVTAISEKGSTVPVLRWHVQQAAAGKQRSRLCITIKRSQKCSKGSMTFSRLLFGSTCWNTLMSRGNVLKRLLLHRDVAQVYCT